MVCIQFCAVVNAFHQDYSRIGVLHGRARLPVAGEQLPEIETVWPGACAFTVPRRPAVDMTILLDKWDRGVLI